MTLALAKYDVAEIAPDPARWATVAEYAKAMHLSDGHAQRNCRTQLAARGVAMIATPIGGGQRQWFVDRSIDARLSAAPINPDQSADLSNFTDAQRKCAYARVACVQSFRDAMRIHRAPVNEWLPRLLEQLRSRFGETIGIKISRSRLYGWNKVYNRPADLVKLIDTRGGDRRGGADPAAWQAFRDLYLNENQPALSRCWEEVCQQASENGWRWCSLKACYAQLDHAIDDLADGGAKLSSDQFLARFVKNKRVMADPSSLNHLMQAWHRPVPVGRNGVRLVIGGRSVSYGQYETALFAMKKMKLNVDALRLMWALACLPNFGCLRLIERTAETIYDQDPDLEVITREHVIDALRLLYGADAIYMEQLTERHADLARKQTRVA